MFSGIRKEMVGTMNLDSSLEIQFAYQIYLLWIRKFNKWDLSFLTNGNEDGQLEFSLDKLITRRLNEWCITLSNMQIGHVS